jgi:hypothetical protein
MTRAAAIALAAFALSACAGEQAATEPAASEQAAARREGTAANANSDWGRFGGRQPGQNSAVARAIQERPAEITGVPYVRAFRLGWTQAAEVPSWEPENQTRRLPEGALQAVLLVEVASLPRDARLQVLWYYGEELAHADALDGREDGEHLFALVKREGGHLVPLPRGPYRVEVRNGPALIKSIPFEVEEHP